MVKKASVRAIALMLSILMVVVLFAGCQGKEPSKQSSDASSTKPQGSQTGQGPEELTLPIVKEPLTLTYFKEFSYDKASATMKSYNEMAAFQELEKLTGIHVEFQHPPAGQATEQFNLMIASQQLPDIIYWNWQNFPGGPVKAMNDGTIIKLNDLIEKYAPNFKKLMDQHPDWRKQVVTDDGSFYMFPFIRDDDFLKSWRGLIIREDWLNKLGLKVPTTIDEWYTVLKAFKTQDPNGNGQADEIPFSVGAFGSFPMFQFAWGLVPDSVAGTAGFYQKDGKVHFGPIEPAYKDYLTTMRQWYKEGLIDPDYPTVDRKMFDAKMTSDIVGACSGGPDGGFMGLYLKTMKDKNPQFSLVGVPYPIGPAGKPYGWKDKEAPGAGAAISSSNKHQIETVKYLDYAYSDEGRLLLNFGPEGQAYNLVDGKIVFTDIVTNNPNGFTFDQALSKYGLSTTDGPFVQHRAVVDKARSYYPQQKPAVETWMKADVSLLMPSITPNEDESQRLAAIMSEVTTYVNEMHNKFIMGQEPLENFDKYVQTIKSMGIDEAIQIEQAALDRYNKR